MCNNKLIYYLLSNLSCLSLTGGEFSVEVIEGMNLIRLF